MTPNPEVTGVNINSSVLKKFSPEQLGALFKASSGQRDPVNSAINKAVLGEERRRADVERKEELTNCRARGTC